MTKSAQRKKRKGSRFPRVQTPTEDRAAGVGDAHSGHPLLSTPQRLFLRLTFFRVTQTQISLLHLVPGEADLSP